MKKITSKLPATLILSFIASFNLGLNAHDLPNGTLESPYYSFVIVTQHTVTYHQVVNTYNNLSPDIIKELQASELVKATMNQEDFDLDEHCASDAHTNDTETTINSCPDKTHGLIDPLWRSFIVAESICSTDNEHWIDLTLVPRFTSPLVIVDQIGNYTFNENLLMKPQTNEHSKEDAGLLNVSFNCGYTIALSAAE